MKKKAFIKVARYTIYTGEEFTSSEKAEKEVQNRA